MSLARSARIRSTRAHAWLYARSGGRLGARAGGHPVLPLTNTGRRTGRTRRTPLQFEELGADDGPGTARTLEGQERAAVWPDLCARNRYLDRVQHRAGREIPVVEITRQPRG